jgi:hypothetical protein
LNCHDLHFDASASRLREPVLTVNPVAGGHRVALRAANVQRDAAAFGRLNADRRTTSYQSLGSQLAVDPDFADPAHGVPHDELLGHASASQKRKLDCLDWARHGLIRGDSPAGDHGRIAPAE